MGLEFLSSLLDSELYSVSPLLSSATWSCYACCCAIDPLHDIAWAVSFILQFFLFVLFEGEQSAVVAELDALVSCDIFVYLCYFFALPWSLYCVNSKQLSSYTDPPCIEPGSEFPFQHQVVCRCHRCWVPVLSFQHIVYHFASQSFVST